MIGEKFNRLPWSPPLRAANRRRPSSGRDDGEERRETQEHSQEWLCHKSALWPVGECASIEPLVRQG